MKTLLKSLQITVLVMALASCATQKRVVNNTPEIKAVVSQVQYDQALKALDEHQFIIKTKEFYFPRGNPRTKVSTDSYVSMQGSEAVMRLSPSLFLGTPIHYLNIMDSAAKITKGKVKKNGDAQFILEINGGHYWTGYKLLITLYGNSNKCEARVNGGKFEMDNNFNFKGEVYPFKDSIAVISDAIVN